MRSKKKKKNVEKCNTIIAFGITCILGPVDANHDTHWGQDFHIVYLSHNSYTIVIWDFISFY